MILQRSANEERKKQREKESKTVTFESVVTEKKLGTCSIPKQTPIPKTVRQFDIGQKLFGEPSVSRHNPSNQKSPKNLSSKSSRKGSKDPASTSSKSRSERKKEQSEENRKEKEKSKKNFGEPSVSRHDPSNQKSPKILSGKSSSKRKDSNDPASSSSSSKSRDEREKEQSEEKRKEKSKKKSKKKSKEKSSKKASSTPSSPTQSSSSANKEGHSSQASNSERTLCKWCENYIENCFCNYGLHP